MKSCFRKILCKALLIILPLAGCAHQGYWPQGKSWAEATLAQLTLRQKIAQMMITYMNMRFINSETDRWQELEDLIVTDGVGGIHLWYGEAGTSLTMMNQMQRLAKVPILFQGDLERGIGQRFPGATHLPPLMALAATGSPDNAYEAGRITALEGRAVGYRLNLGPIVDLNNNPANPIINVRAFGEDPGQVTEYATAYLKGMHDHGMAGTAKHFPGHGDTDVDSHIDIPTISSDSTRLWQFELAPYRPLIAAGVDAILTAHIQAPDFQPHGDTPATLSRFWITDILREQLGFQGAVVTDAMFMGAITENYSTAYALVEAINAGADIIIQNVDVRGAINIVETAVNDGLISRARIDEAALRMLRLKEKVGLHRQRFLDVETTRRDLGRDEFKRAADRIAAESITLIKNDGGLVPLRYAGPVDTLYIIDLYDYPYNHSRSTVTETIANTGLPVKTLQLDESDGAHVYDEILGTIPEGGRVLVNAFVGFGVRKDRIFLPDIQLDFVQRLITKTDRLIIASLGTPYLAQAFPDVPAYLCAYNNSPLMQKALAQALLGYSPVSGRIPVTIPGVADRGAGLGVQADSLAIPESAGKSHRGADVDMPAGTIAATNELATSAVQLVRVLPREAGIDTGPLDSLVTQWQTAHTAGGILLAARAGAVFYHEAFGVMPFKGRQTLHRGDIFPLLNIGRGVKETFKGLDYGEQTAAAVMRSGIDNQLFKTLGLTATYLQFPRQRTARLVVSPVDGSTAEPAPLYSSARDLAILAQTILNGGVYRGNTVLDPVRVSALLEADGASTELRSRWLVETDLKLPEMAGKGTIGQIEPNGSFLLIDPANGLIVVLLIADPAVSTEPALAGPIQEVLELIYRLLPAQ